MLENPLYKELEKIGRDDMSLKPLVLGKHKHLLGSPEVQRRAAANPNTQLPVIAGRALRDAIKTLPNGYRRIVGEAVLCAKPEYEHLIVKQRRELLEESPKKISYDQWRYHRRLALEAVFRYLSSPALSPALPNRTEEAQFQPDHDASMAEAELAVAFIPFMERAIALHYAVLAQLFTQDIASWLWRESGLRLAVILPEQSSEDPLAHYLFDSFTELIGASWLGDGLEERLTLALSSSANTVRDIFWMISDATPMGLRSWSDDEALKPTVAPKQKYAQYKSFAEHAYASHWTPWYREHCSPLAESSRDSPLASIAALSGALESMLLGSQLEPYFRRRRDPTHEQARLQAHKVISAYYKGINDSAPLANELSLRQHADVYFNMQGTLLTDRGIKWYSKEIEAV